MKQKNFLMLTLKTQIDPKILNFLVTVDFRNLTFISFKSGNHMLSVTLAKVSGTATVWRPEDVFFINAECLRACCFHSSCTQTGLV